MKYNININQNKAVEWELNSSEAIVFSWIYSLPSWAEKIVYQEELYYFGNRDMACEELPLVAIEADTMYRIFKSLKNKGLISIIQIDKKDYISLTEKSKEWYDSEKNPNLGKKSESRKKIRISEKNPTDHIYNNINNIKKKNKDKSLLEKESDLEEKAQCLYDLYPTKCPKRGTPLGKSQKDKIKIKKMLKTFSFEMLKFTIEKEIEEKYDKAYMLNFSTFLNNLPDFGYQNEPDDKNTKKIIVNGIEYK